MILAYIILFLASILLFITIHAMFFQKDDIDDVEISKEDLIEFIKKLNL